MIEKPTISEEVFVINEDLNAHYSVFRNDAVFRRSANSWPFWEKMPYVAPTSNGFLTQSVADGAKYDCQTIAKCCADLQDPLPGHVGQAATCDPSMLHYGKELR